MSLVTKKKIGDLFKISKGKKSEEDPSSNLRYIQIDDLRNDNNIKLARADLKNITCTKLDVLIAWDGANAGTIGYDLEGVIGSTLAKLVPKNDSVNSHYAGRFLQSKFRYLRDNCTGATIPHISKPSLVNLDIPLPLLDEQKKIADILDAADSLRQKDKQLVEHYDRLSQSLFLDMFGDPVVNPKNWVIYSLATLGEFKNGLNYKQGESGVKIKYLGVGSFKNHSKIKDMDTLKFIDLDNEPSEGYFLKNNDLVFVRSNGNAKLVGRCVVVYPDDIKVTYSGFCIRYRITDEKTNAVYLAHLFREKSFREVLLKAGQGANIQNINQKLLSELNIPLPPNDLQQNFAQKIKDIEEQKELAQRALQKSDDLFNSLLQRAFKGQLTNS